MSDEIRIPDVEIIVGAAGTDVAVFCFYKREDIHQGYEVVCAVADQDARAVIRQILQDAITTLSNSSWYTMDELREGTSEETADEPF